MAQVSLPVLAHPAFPQVFAAATHEFARSISTQPPLGLCDYSTEFGDCQQIATVHHLQLEQQFCAGHFRKVVRRG
jgi:hypothetical protein